MQTVSVPCSWVLLSPVSTNVQNTDDQWAIEVYIGTSKPDDSQMAIGRVVSAREEVGFVLGNGEMLYARVFQLASKKRVLVTLRFGVLSV